MTERNPKGPGSGFEWHTDVEAGPELIEPDFDAPKPVRRLPYWMFALAAALALLAGVLYGQARRRIDLAEDLRAVDIRASFDLVREADSRQDLELVDNVMSARDGGWRTAYLGLLEEGLLFERQGFGLDYLGGDFESAEVLFSPDFRSASLTSESRYLWLQSFGISQTIRLRPAFTFRRSDRWLWSAPDDEFWGGAEDESHTGRFLSVTYPPRDRDIARRLANDLDQLVGRLCDQGLPLDCLGARRLELILSRAPAALLAVAQEGHDGEPALVATSGLPAGYRLSLPTPTLVGLPEDELGYQVLRRGYARYLVLALAQAKLEPDCCGSEPLRQAALRQLLVEAGLQPWSEAKLTEALPPHQRPPEDIVQLCSRANGQDTELLVYDFADSSWTELVVPRIDVEELRAAPSNDGILLRAQNDRRIAGYVMAGYVSTVYWWRQGSLQEVAQWRHFARDARWDVREGAPRLLAHRTSAQTDIGAYFVFDLSRCDLLGCDFEFLGRARGPAWSPDGQQVLFSGPRLVWRRANGVDEPVGPGIAPFWVSADEFGYIRTYGRRQVDVVTVKLPDGEVNRVITLRELGLSIAESNRPERLVIGKIIVNPADRNRWLLLAFVQDGRESVGAALLLQYSPDEDALQLLLRSEKLNSFNLSPDGRWLAVLASEPEAGQWLLGVFDLADGRQTRAYTMPGLEAGSADLAPQLEWSSDGSWLLYTSGGRPNLINPSLDRPLTLAPPSAGCVSAVWMNRPPPETIPPAQ